jgi:hypothetical protein
MKEGLIKGEVVKSVAGGHARTKSICVPMFTFVEEPAIAVAAASAASSLKRQY